MPRNKKRTIRNKKRTIRRTRRTMLRKRRGGAPIGEVNAHKEVITQPGRPPMTTADYMESLEQEHVRESPGSYEY